jgi:hypothetical protein
MIINNFYFGMDKSQEKMKRRKNVKVEKLDSKFLSYVNSYL